MSVQSMMTDKSRGTGYWQQLTDNSIKGLEYDPLLAEQYRQVHLNLLARWADVRPGQAVLKTDLFAEAMSPTRAFFWDMLKTFDNVTGIDLSGDIVSRAEKNALKYAPGSSATYMACDVRRMPFGSNSFDLIFSDSTLDHFARIEDIDIALSELQRVLKPAGTLIITLDNKNNLTEPLFRLWLAFGLSPFFIGKTYSIKELHRALDRVGLRIIDSTAIIHNPRFFTKAVITVLRKMGGGRFDRLVRQGLTLLDRLENTGIKYMTAQFIAVKAVKEPE
jgi:SAM-dependent methyltransferase